MQQTETKAQMIARHNADLEVFARLAATYYASARNLRDAGCYAESTAMAQYGAHMSATVRQMISIDYSGMAS
jgi:hypothetical protein